MPSKLEGKSLFTTYIHLYIFRSIKCVFILCLSFILSGCIYVFSFSSHSNNFLLRSHGERFCFWSIRLFGWIYACLMMPGGMQIGSHTNITVILWFLKCVLWMTSKICNRNWDRNWCGIGNGMWTRMWTTWSNLKHSQLFFTAKPWFCVFHCIVGLDTNGNL